MGCGASKGGASEGAPRPVAAKPQKDVEDLTLTEIVMEVTAIPKYDELFSSVAGPLNTVVGLNNDVFDALTAVKELAGVLSGAYGIDMRIAKTVDRLDVVVTTPEGTPLDAVTAGELLNNMGEELEAADGAVGVAVAALAKAMESAGTGISLKVQDAGDVVECEGGCGTEEAVEATNRAIAELKKTIGSKGKVSVAVKPAAAAESAPQLDIVKNVGKDGEKVAPGPITLAAESNLGSLLGALQAAREAAACVGAAAAAAEGTDLTVLAGRKVSTKGSSEAVKDAVGDFNVAAFSALKAALVLNAKVGVDTAFMEIVHNIKVAVADAIPKPNFEVGDDGGFDVDISWECEDGPKTMADLLELCPSAVTAAWDAVTQCRQAVKTAADALPSLEAQITEMQGKAKEVTADPKGAASEAGLGFTEAFTAVRKTAANMKELAEAPKIVDGLRSTMTEVANEMRRGIEAVSA